MTLETAVTEAIRKRAPRVHNGTYSVTHPRSGHFTLKLWTSQKGNLAGKRVISLLTGPDNVKDYTGVAFWDDEKGLVHVWKKHRGPDSYSPIDGYHWQKQGWSIVERKLAVWADLAIRGATAERCGYWFGEGCTLERASRCCVCNRVLTHPVSIEYGLGPECAQR